MDKKERELLNAKGHDFKDWLQIEMMPSSVAGREVWLKQADEWESKGKAITRQEVLILMGDVLTLDERREILAGTSPILAGFTLIDEPEAGQ